MGQRVGGGFPLTASISIWTPPSSPLPRIDPDAIRAASRTFPTGTGVGVDTIAPRAFMRLSDSALACLANMLMQFEAVGHWGVHPFVVLIVLLNKSDGGLRPIGLFPSIIRIWMRVRFCILREWERGHASPCLFGGSGMGAQRAALVAAFNAEHAAASGGAPRHRPPRPC